MYDFYQYKLSLKHNHFTNRFKKNEHFTYYQREILFMRLKTIFKNYSKILLSKKRKKVEAKEEGIRHLLEKQENRPVMGNADRSENN